MAKFNTAGLEEIERQFLLQSENAVKAVPLMLEAGANVIIEAQKAEAARLNISGRSKGALVNSIKADKVKGSETSRYFEVDPHGVDRSHTRAGVRNAEKGFVLEYGRSNMPAKPWMSTANEKAAEDVVSAELEAWEKVNNGSGQST
jgi:HK97 gp10 family phage protein